MFTADQLKYELNHMELIDMAQTSPEMLTFVIVEKTSADDEFLALPAAAKTYIMQQLKDNSPVLEMRNTSSPVTHRKGFQITIMVVPEGATAGIVKDGE